jgi:hypothetical protein
MKKTVNDIKNLCNLLQYMSREPGLFSNGYISYIAIGKYAKYVDLHFMNGSIYNFDSYTKNYLYVRLFRYAKIHLEKWDQKEKSKREKKRFNHAKRELEQIEKDL